MDVLRTPDERLSQLENHDVDPQYREVTAADDTRLPFHFLDEGPRDAAPVLLLHGNPPWSFVHQGANP